MVIAVDIDNVLFDFIGSFVDFTTAELGYSVNREDIKSNRLYDLFHTTPEGHWELFLQYYNSSYCDEALPIDGAREVLTTLKSGNRIIAITGRPETTREKTEIWLQKEYPGLIDEVLFTNSNLPSDHPNHFSKSQICFEHGADVIVDDDHMFANECAEQGIPTIYFKTPYNENDKKHDNLLVASDWPHVLTIIKSIGATLDRV